MRDRERGRDTGRGRSRLPTRSPMWNLIPDSGNYALSWRQTLNCWALQASQQCILINIVMFSNTKKTASGVPGWLSWLPSDSSFWLRSWPQGGEIKSPVGFCAGCGACLGFSLPLLLPLPHSYSFSLSLKKIDIWYYFRFLQIPLMLSLMENCWILIHASVVNHVRCFSWSI